MHAQHDITLTDSDENSVNLILCDGRGNRNSLGISHTQVPTTAVQTANAYPSRSDRRVPFNSIQQDAWGGGRGNRYLHKDITRYWDNWRVAASRSDRIISGGAERYSTGYGTVEIFDEREERYFVELAGSNAYLARSFTPSNNHTTPTFIVWVENRIKDDAIHLGIYSDSGGEPDALLGTATKTTSSDGSPIQTLEVKLAPGTTLTASTTYHAVFWRSDDEYAVSDLAESNFDSYGAVACEYESGGNASADGITWAASSWRPVFVLYDDNDHNDVTFRTFTYRGAQYGYDKPVTGNSYLYINGDRGVADSNSGDLTKLNDATKSWTSDEHIGKIARIVYGPGVDEDQPWRVITDNDSTSLTVSPAWKKTHDATQTEYVIVGGNDWTQLLDLGGRAWDHAVAGNIVYFARGDQDADLKLLRYQAYNNAGAFATRSATEDNYQASILRSRYNSTYGCFELWGVNNEDDYGDRLVWNGLVPKSWDDLYDDLGLVASTNIAWTDVSVANVIQSTFRGLTFFNVGAAFTTGDIGTYILPAAEDLTTGRRLMFQVLSTVNAAAGDIVLKIDDGTGTTTNLDLPALTANVWQWVMLDITPSAHTAPNESAATKLILNLATDNGAQYVYLSGGIRLIRRSLNIAAVHGNGRITNLVFWNGNPAEPIMNPWIITEDGVGEIQTQNSNAVAWLPNSELATMQDFRNGKAAFSHDLFLYFSLHDGLEKLYQNGLEDMGPNRGEGLPYERAGNIIASAGWAGGFFLAVDAGEDGYSSIILHDGGYHEFYRASRTGERIRSMAIEAIPGDAPDRLWFEVGGHVMWLPVAANPTALLDYKFTHDGSIDISYVVGSLIDTQKYFDKMKAVIATRDHATLDAIDDEYPSLQIGSASGTVHGEWIEVYYRLNDDKTDEYPWSYIGKYSPSAANSDEIIYNFYDLLGEYITGQRIQIKLRLRNETLIHTSDIRGIVFDLIEKVEGTDTFSVTYLLHDDSPNLQGRRSYELTNTDWDQLNTWRDNPTQLTMVTNRFNTFGTKTVQIVRNEGNINLADSRANKETMIGRMVLIETG